MRTWINDLIVVEKLANWEKLKTLVLDSVSSPITRRVYDMALEELLAWFQQAPRPGFTKISPDPRQRCPRHGSCVVRRLRRKPTRLCHPPRHTMFSHLERRRAI